MSAEHDDYDEAREYAEAECQSGAPKPITNYADRRGE